MDPQLSNTEVEKSSNMNGAWENDQSFYFPPTDLFPWSFSRWFPQGRKQDFVYFSASVTRLSRHRSPSEEVPFIVSGQKWRVEWVSLRIADNRHGRRSLLCASEIQSAARLLRGICQRGLKRRAKRGEEIVEPEQKLVKISVHHGDMGLTRTASQYEVKSIGKQAVCPESRVVVRKKKHLNLFYLQVTF